MSRKWIILMLIGLMIVNVTGCQLAKAELEATGKSDRLIGAYVTYEYLDLYDYETFFNENTDKLMTGKDLMKVDKYRNRLYAKPTPDEDDKYVFENIEGVLFIDYSYIGEDGESYSTVSNSNLVSVVGISVNDQGKTIEGTMILRKADYVQVYMNPVYKDEEDNVYLLAGTGLSFDGDGIGNASQWISEDHTVTVGSETKEESFSVKMNFVCKDLANQYVIKQFDEEDQVVDTLIIQVDHIPSEISRVNQSSYMIMEKHKDGLVINREVINGDVFNIHYFGDRKAAQTETVKIK